MWVGSLSQVHVGDLLLFYSTCKVALGKTQILSFVLGYSWLVFQKVPLYMWAVTVELTELLQSEDFGPCRD